MTYIVWIISMSSSGLKVAMYDDGQFQPEIRQNKELMTCDK
jgi:hypothetical protein